jgi:UDP-glucuronate 4-epimerase
VALMEFIAELQAAIGLSARLEMKPMQAGDVTDTCADVTRLKALMGRTYRFTPLAEGLSRFVKWYREHHGHAIAFSRAA